MFKEQTTTRRMLIQAHIEIQQHRTANEAYFFLTCATPSSQPLITSLRPILNLKGLFLSREESNFFPFCSIPVEENLPETWDKEKKNQDHSQLFSS